MRRSLTASTLIVLTAALWTLFSNPFLAPQRDLLIERAAPISIFLAVVVFDLALLIHAALRRLGLAETGRKIALLESRLADWDDSPLVRKEEDS